MLCSQVACGGGGGDGGGSAAVVVVEPMERRAQADDGMEDAPYPLDDHVQSGAAHCLHYTRGLPSALEALEPERAPTKPQCTASKAEATRKNRLDKLTHSKPALGPEVVQAPAQDVAMQTAAEEPAEERQGAHRDTELDGSIHLDGSIEALEDAIAVVELAHAKEPDNAELLVHLTHLHQRLAWARARARDSI